MPNHTITNNTESILDMSPLHDLLGRRLTLRAKEEREISDNTFNNDIVQRMVKAKWVSASEASLASPLMVAARKDPETDMPTSEMVGVVKTASDASNEPPTANEAGQPAAVEPSTAKLDETPKPMEAGPAPAEEVATHGETLVETLAISEAPMPSPPSGKSKRR